MQHDEVTTARGRNGRSVVEDLPYRIELWRTDSDEIECVLARAASVELARAIFNAAQRERPDRRITLRQGSRLLTDSAA